MNKNFKHTQFAHCESGVVSSLLTHYGLKISEPMVFGITSSLEFAYFPIIKLNNLPLIAYRGIPKNIIKKIEKTLGINMHKQQFKNALDANAELTKLIASGKLVGLQTSVFYLPYFPADMRFHFNAHNLLVFGKKNKKFQISDPVFEEAVECSESDLMRARFAKGVFAPKGFLYYPTNVPQNVDLTPIIKKAIRKNARAMTTKFPWVGVRGMRTLAKKIENLKGKDERYIKNFLTHIVRMQEEIGTGGGGFRFVYAAFLQEAMNYNLDNQKLKKASELITDSGDTLRDFALKCVQSAKNPKKFNPKAIAEILVKASKIEERAYGILKGI